MGSWVFILSREKDLKGVNILGTFVLLNIYIIQNDF